MCIRDRCSSLTILDVSNWNASAVDNMQGMFDDCTSLQTIYAASGTDWSSGTGGEGMFNGCTYLEGGNGTVYHEQEHYRSYARIDGLKGKRGYCTDIKDKPVPLPKAITFDLAKKTAMRCV